jgi:glutamate dehydrogenase/leucine dehydrogenase
MLPQVVPADIDWIVARARRRGLAAPPAFMSSKPRTGINHKEYGVTSEGVFVFLDEALKQAGKDPRAGQRVTIKLTGGPVRSYTLETVLQTLYPTKCSTEHLLYCGVRCIRIVMALLFDNTQCQL